MVHRDSPDLFVSMVFLAAGAVKGMLGLGLPTLAVGLLGILMPVGSAASLVTIPSLITNVWQAWRGPHLPALARRLWPLQLAGVVGTVLASLLFPNAVDEWGRRLLGTCLLAYGGIGLFGRVPPALPEMLQRRVGVIAGFAGGAITPMTGVFVLPGVPYLQSLRFTKEELTQALGLSFTVSTLALATTLAWRGDLGVETSTVSLIMVIPALVGMWLGQEVRHMLSEGLFRRCFFAALAILGVLMLAHS